MGLDQIVSVVITATSAGVTQAGFGVPMILGTPSWVTDKIRFYTDISGVAADFATTRPEYLAAAAIFAQSPRPPKIAIGKLTSKLTQSWDITPSAFNSTVYTVFVNGQTASYTSDGTATVAEICTGLAGAINTLAISGLTATDNTTKVTVALGTAGDWAHLQVDNISLLSLAQVQADPGVGADLDAILLVDSSWYAIINPWNSALMAVAIASWAETNKRLFLCDTQDSQCALHALSGATDVMAALKTSARKYTATIYHPDNGSFIAAAWAGALLPLDPGSETWALKQLSGPSAVSLTGTYRTNILAKNGNVYEQVAGLNITEFGTVQDGEYIDVIRLIDWTSARMKERVFTILAQNPKVPYTDAGISMLAGAVRSVLSDGVAVGGYASYQVQVPTAASQSSADRAARVVRNLNFSAILAGAAHTVAIQGTVSV
jgi:hypothetical protein